MTGYPRRTFPLSMLIAAIGVVAPLLVHAQSDEEEALSDVREQIEAVQRRLARQTGERDDGISALKGVEFQIAATRSELERLGAGVREQQDRHRALTEQRHRAAARLDAERAALAQQVRLSYMTGREEFFKLLLSQENPASLGRMMVYYDYFNRARSARIGAVAAELQTLSLLTEQVVEVQGELDSVKSAEQAELAQLQRSRDDRQRLLVELQANVSATGSEIEQLREEERRLQQLLVELGELLAGFPVSSEEPFAQLRGRLAWPVRGRLASDYGQRRGAGPLTWNGVLLESVQGTPVRAIYHGRVAFADWLPGLGLLLIVDHGDGFMSLYGHNETLLKESGDRATPGEVIALVGDSGGRGQPALYFEIRYNGEPVDPHLWVPDEPIAVN